MTRQDQFGPGRHSPSGRKALQLRRVSVGCKHFRAKLARVKKVNCTEQKPEPESPTTELFGGTLVLFPSNPSDATGQRQRNKPSGHTQLTAAIFRFACYQRIITVENTSPDLSQRSLATGCHGAQWREAQR